MPYSHFKRFHLSSAAAIFTGKKFNHRDHRGQRDNFLKVSVVSVVKKIIHGSLYPIGHVSYKHDNAIP